MNPLFYPTRKQGKRWREMVALISVHVLQPSWPLTDVIRALRARSPKKSRKKVAGASRPRGQKRLKKVEKRSKTSQKQPFFDLFNFFSTFSQPFLAPGPKGPGNFFSTFLGFRARRARMTPVRGQEGCNACLILSDHRSPHCCSDFCSEFRFDFPLLLHKTCRNDELGIGNHKAPESYRLLTMMLWRCIMIQVLFLERRVPPTFPLPTSSCARD